MKIIFASFLLVLSTMSPASAQTTDLIVFDKQGNPVANPYAEAGEYYCYPDTKSCFVGDAQELVDKINSDYYSNADDSLHDAKVVTSDTIFFIWGMLGGPNFFTVHRCNF